MRGQKFATHLNKLRQSRQGSIFGVAEISALAASFVILLAALFAYFYMLTPQRARLEDLQRKRTQLQTRLRESQVDVKRSTDTQSTVTEISGSLQSFESSTLAQRNAGRTLLINELNNAIRRNKRSRLQILHRQETIHRCGDNVSESK